MGCDHRANCDSYRRAGFNSRTPCGVRLVCLVRSSCFSRFQFTHPVWGATQYLLIIRYQQTSFNSRTPCGVRLWRCPLLFPILMFQFTHPVWGATGLTLVVISNGVVSIHAPRVGCDLKRILVSLTRVCFNSRTPCGVRPTIALHSSEIRMFQFTHPVWGATPCGTCYACQSNVSIHAPRVGCDKATITT